MQKRPMNSRIECEVETTASGNRKLLLRAVTVTVSA